MWRIGEGSPHSKEGVNGATVSTEKSWERESLSKKQKLQQVGDKQRHITRTNTGADFPRWKSGIKEKCSQTDIQVFCHIAGQDIDYTRSIYNSPRC